MDLKKICDSFYDQDENVQSKLNELLSWLSQDALDDYLAYFNRLHETSYSSFQDVASDEGDLFVLNELENMMPTDQWNEFENYYERIVLDN